VLHTRSTAQREQASQADTLDVLRQTSASIHVASSIRSRGVRAASFPREHDQLDFIKVPADEHESTPLPMEQFGDDEHDTVYRDAGHEVDAAGERSAHAETIEMYAVHRTREFNERTRRQPHDENAWLQFAAFQRDPCHLSRNVRTALDKQVSIYDRALLHLPQSTALLLAKLTVCEVCVCVWGFFLFVVCIWVSVVCTV
jgi:NRDE-2, necessary for RNA interference